MPQARLHLIASTFLAATLALVAPVVSAQVTPAMCGDLRAAQGPYDYRVERYWVPFIERNHFTPQVESLIRGVAGYVGSDIDFLLRHIPNHPRGLIAMTRLSERSQWQRPQGATYDIECYYERALRFQPDDVIVRMLYVSYLTKRSRREEALVQLRQAKLDAGENGFTHYNIGLLYLDLDQPDLALESARRAQALGFVRPELIDRLKAAGRWTDAAAPAPAAAASTPAPATQ